MEAVRVNLPSVLAAGRRVGFNRIVRAIEGDLLLGRDVDGCDAEVAPTELVLSVRPAGFSQDQASVATLYRLDADRRRLVVLSVASWPDGAKRLASAARRALAKIRFDRHNGAGSETVVSRAGPSGMLVSGQQTGLAAGCERP